MNRIQPTIEDRQSRRIAGAEAQRYAWSIGSTAIRHQEEYFGIYAKAWSDDGDVYYVEEIDPDSAFARGRREIGIAFGWREAERKVRRYDIERRLRDEPTLFDQTSQDHA